MIGLIYKECLTATYKWQPNLYFFELHEHFGEISLIL